MVHSEMAANWVTRTARRHGLTLAEIERHNFDRAGWERIVRKMSKHAPDIVTSDKIQTITDALARGHF